MKRNLSAAKGIQTFTGPDCKLNSFSIHEVNNLGLENKLEQLRCVSGCTDVVYEGLQLLQSGFQPLWRWCSSVGFTLSERLKGFQSTLSCLDVAAVLLLCTGLLPSSL